MGVMQGCCGSLENHLALSSSIFFVPHGDWVFARWRVTRMFMLLRSSRRQHRSACFSPSSGNGLWWIFLHFSSLVKFPHPGANILFKVCQNSPPGAWNVDQSPHSIPYPPPPLGTIIDRCITIEVCLTNWSMILAISLPQNPRKCL